MSLLERHRWLRRVNEEGLAFTMGWLTIRCCQYAWLMVTRFEDGAEHAFHNWWGSDDSCGEEDQG